MCKGGLSTAVLLLALIGTAIADEFILPEADDVIGAVGVVQTVYDDTLLEIGRRYGLGYEEMRLANPTVDVWLPGEGTTVELPTRFVLPRAERKGLVINIAEYRIYYFSAQNDQTIVATFPISIGRMDWGTPLGRSSIVNKVRNPTWYPPISIREEWAAEGRELEKVVPPGPDNPLGDYAMRLSIPGYLIHGTNRPAGVGMRVTHGCIRMYPEDIEWLFPKIPIDTPVQMVNQPFKFGWSGDQLLFEAHAPLQESAESEAPTLTLTTITELYVQATGNRAATIDWPLVGRVFADQRGIPVVVGRAVSEPDDAEKVSMK